MLNNISILIFLIFGAFIIGTFEAEEAPLLRRVKRDAMAESNKTKLANVTLTKSDGDPKSSNVSSSTGKEEEVAADSNGKPKLDKDLKNFGVDLKTAITEMRRLQTPVLRVSRRYSVAAAPGLDGRSCKARQQKKRSADKDAHADADKGRLYFAADTGKERNLHKLHPRAHSPFEIYGDREKLYELLTGETEASNGGGGGGGGSGSAAAAKHYESGKNSRFHSKLKRSAKNEMTSRHNLHKDERDFEGQVSNYATVKESPIIKLTKMLVNLEEADDLSHLQSVDDSNGPPDIVFKPFGIDSDEASFVGPTDYFLNSLSQEYAFSPGALSDFPMASVPNGAPLKLLSNEGDAEASANKEGSDSEEYEMTCPVHFKRSVNNGSNDGVVEVCSCHLYRKKKQIA